MENDNIYGKMQKIKNELLELNLKKSGQNKFAGYSYYELSDITPAIIELCNKYRVFTGFSYNQDLAILEIINIDNPVERLTYTSPMEELELKGCNKIQALGGTETYQRRYLYMSAFDIIENDMFDATITDMVETKEDAEKYTINFGKYKGKTLKEISETNKQYLEWLIDNTEDENIKKAINLLTGMKKLTNEESKEAINEMPINEGQKQWIKDNLKEEQIKEFLKKYGKPKLSELTFAEAEKIRSEK